MLETSAEVHRDNDSSLSGIMSDKIHGWPFSLKVETAIKSVTLLTGTKSDKDIFEVLCANDSVPPGTEFQTPCVHHVVLLGQLKSHGIEVEHRYTTYLHDLPPPWGTKIK